MSRLLKCIALSCLIVLLGSGRVDGQTDFAPGEIMFTGYNSDGTDGFSIVLLTDVVAGTVIYITDRGWSNSSGFRVDSDGEGTISFEFTADFPCGTSFVFLDDGSSPNFWRAFDSNGVQVGTIVIQAGGDMNGMEFNVGGGFFPPDGDQLFIYQSPEPNPGNQTGFVTGIHMNGGPWNGGNGDDYSSMQPTGLANNQVVRFNTEVDNAKYLCSPNAGLPAFLQAAITNDNGAGLKPDAANNWNESNDPIALSTLCNFCCGTTIPIPELSAEMSVTPNQMFTINITGTLAAGESWELYTAGCGVGTPVQTTSTSSFTVTAPGTEGIVTYYVKSSEDVGCNTCGIIQVGVCINQNNMNTCTDCSANPLTCGNCLLPDPADNPDLDSGCYAIKLIFILDESGSIGADEPNVKAGVLAFLNALNGQDMEVALIEFSDLGRVVNNYTPINTPYIQNVTNYFDNIPFPGSGHTYIPGGGTNWHDAMIKADAMASADMIMFFTDGIPTGWTNGSSVDYCGNGSTTQTPEIVNPVKLANKLKGEGTHMFMLGVGANIDSVNLELMSGYIKYESGVNTIGTADYSIGNFQDLAEDLQEFVSELCVTPIQIQKDLYGAICNGWQQFRFIVTNLGTESAATVVVVEDIFPSGYENITYNGPPGIKLCINELCDGFPGNGYPPLMNGFRWVINSVPPLGSDTLYLSVMVNDNATYDNYVIAEGNNTDIAQDSVIDPILIVDDVPPDLTCPTNITINCSESTLPANTGFAIADDPDGSFPPVEYVDVTVAGVCADEYTITRTWSTVDGCANTAQCVQTIVVLSIPPEFDDCPVTRNIEGCAPTVITGPSYSTITATSSVEVFENATNQGSTSGICGTTNITYIDVAAGSCPIVVTRTWTVSDGCGNTATCLQTINVIDIAPSITACPQVRNLEGCTTAAITGPVYATMTTASSEAVFENATNMGTVSDGCGITSVTYRDVASNTCPIVVTRTWTINDACGNSSTCNQTINVDDSVVPVLTTCAVTRNIEGCGTSAITSPAYSTVSATSSEAQFENGTNQGVTSDVCGISTVTYIDVATSTCPTVVTRTWTISDACGNSATCAQTINVDDTVAPAISTCPVTRNFDGCNTSVITNPPYSAVTATTTESIFENGANQGATSDACTVSSVTYIDVSAGTCPTVVTRTWTISDACGNTSTCTQTININDTPPVINTCAVTRNIEGCAPDVITGPVFSTVSNASSESEFENATNLGSTSGACNLAAVTYVDVVVGTCPIVVTRTWTISDVCGNSTTCAQTINVDDTAAPAITTLPITRNIEGCGNSAITDPPYSTISAVSSEVVFENATNLGVTSDLCGISAVTYIDVVTGTCPRVVTRTWTVSDACGNFITCNQTINVDDTLSPVIATCPITRNIQGCNTSAITGPVFSTVTASSTPMQFQNATNQGSVSDVCGVTAVTYIDVATGTCPRVVTRTWTVSDACGNSSTCNQTINVDDTVAPTIGTCAVTRNIQGCSTSAITMPVYSAVTANSTEAVFEATPNLGASSDVCGITSVSYIDVTTGTCPIVVTRTWTIGDACGNISTCNQTINVDDTVSPAITTLPVARTIEGCTASAVTGPAYSSSLAASSEAEFENATNQGVTSDVCGVATVMYIDVAAGSCPVVVTRTWTVTDACGNTQTCNQIIHIEDTTSPDLTCPANITISCTASTDPTVTGMETASDNCDPSPILTYADATVSSPSCDQEYTINRTWTATDACGNSVTCLQVITIDDSVAPDIVCPPDITITCIENTLPVNTESATASDACDTAPAIVYADVTMAIPMTNSYLIERTWTTTDACGNENTCLQLITVDNPLDPDIIGEPFDTICSGGIVLLEAFDQGISPMSYEWTFGSGSSPSVETGIGPHDVAYIYDGTNGSTGAWVILTVGTPGCEDVSDTVANVHVNAIPNAGITSPGGNPCVLIDKIFQPTAAEMPGFSYNWNFGDGASMQTATGYGPHEVWYDSAGVKTVQLIVFSNEQGASCGDTSTLTFNVNSCFGNITGKVQKSDGTPISNVNLRLYADQNLDGVKDNNTWIKNAFTTAQGIYTMSGLLPGNYVIEQTQPVGFISFFEQDTSEDYDVVFDLNMNDNVLPATIGSFELDAGNFFYEVTSPGSITGYVFQDFNGNQMPAPIEGISGVTVQLYTDTNTNGVADPGGFVASTTTSSSGFYAFGDLLTGSYVIIEQHPSAFTSVMDNDVSNDNDIVPNTNMLNDTIPATVTNAETDAGNYFIEFAECSKIVTTTQDGAPGSLRYMIDCVENNDTITFHPLLVNQTLILNSGRIEIDKNVFIHSDLTPKLMIESSVNGSFLILQGASVEFKNIDITSGLSGFPGAAFDNYGDLKLWDVGVFRNDLLLTTDYLIFNGVPGIMTIKGSTVIDSD